MKIAFLDTYYPEVFPLRQERESYDERMKRLMDLRFGTSDYYSEAFKSYGWEAIDIIANDPWWGGKQATYDQLLAYRPDVLYCQDLSFFSASELRDIKSRTGCRLAAQHSCPWAGDEQVGAFDVVFTSFPHYLPRIAATGASAEFLQIGFGRKNHHPAEDTLCRSGVTFVGGLNASHGHWTQGTDNLRYLAAQVPEFTWHGYWIGEPDHDTQLAKAYRGHAWGDSMYQVYKRSKIVVNRHGEVAQGYANNMRLFEATGCGALLLTEDARNLGQYFEKGVEVETYSSQKELVRKVGHYLTNEEARLRIARAGQRRTMRDHCYDTILRRADEVLRGILP